MSHKCEHSCTFPNKRGLWVNPTPLYLSSVLLGSNYRAYWASTTNSWVVLSECETCPLIAQCYHPKNKGLCVWWTCYKALCTFSTPLHRPKRKVNWNNFLCDRDIFSSEWSGVFIINLLHPNCKRLVCLSLSVTPSFLLNGKAEAGLSSEGSYLARSFGVIKFTNMRGVILVTLCCVT